MLRNSEVVGPKGPCREVDMGSLFGARRAMSNGVEGVRELVDYECIAYGEKRLTTTIKSTWMIVVNLAIDITN